MPLPLERFDMPTKLQSCHSVEDICRGEKLQIEAGDRQDQLQTAAAVLGNFSIFR